MLLLPSTSSVLRTREAVFANRPPEVRPNRKNLEYPSVG